ncbi:MAG TPA: glycosyltransferase family 4 protein [Gemmatimonadaceae bacterium]|nr:glycosyltransferase family 4 protein [Gemmatimonadaceae bacterium]
MTPIHLTMLLRQQIRFIVDAGIDYTLVSSPGSALDELAHTLSVRCHPIPMARTPNPPRDLVSLIVLTRFLARERFDVVHSSTPKAGLLAALAGCTARVPVRIHTFTGQPWVELRGPMRWISRQSDRLIGLLNTHTYADSPSQRVLLVNESIVDAAKISVLGDGSISGVDLRRFDPAACVARRSPLRRDLAIPESALVITYVGRLAKEKGIVELVSAFRQLRQRRNDLYLLFVGQSEPERDPLPSEVLAEISNDRNMRSVGFVFDPEVYLAASDIFCLPSYREGFGSAVIEAGAMSLPTVATRVTGLVDAVVEGETGMLVPPKDVAQLSDALLTLIQSPELRRRMGQAAQRRARERFDASAINQAVVDEYVRLVAKTKT